ncbi:hypothetical protein RL72_00482 [Microbacterium azadirachtae]|uniref:5-methylcytosine-specific restriction enzyme A n=1 Tax=Microbacterium azadirachtae TaxID=582680 RepID=A0A0F0L2M0_9MICO|nr:hypothetical protein [Microbacterium azadirachtae]KJL27387.1 hypothetical protein RL72_00482 [Microbacterium azadirachtae]SFR59519.1 5-methylcytosine-specific restriction enzyme A [Microbacterium azadirachtae]
MPSPAFRLRAGDIVTRADLVVEYGGSVQSGGIVPSNTSNSVFVFTDPAEGRQFGYVYDGFSQDGTVFHYTGAGRDGDQKLTGSNSPILTHGEKGRSLHAFSAAGVVVGSSAKLQRYIGEFILDPDVPFERMPALDRSGALRTVLVFRLLPVSSIPDDVVELVGYSGVTREPNVISVPVEINSTEFFETADRAGGLAVRRESQLVDEFIAHQVGHTFTRWAINLPAERTRLLTDIYDEADRTLYEAKAIAGRSDLRMAVGQLYDYRRHVSVDDLRCSVLLPERPTADLRDLLREAGLGLAFREQSTFVLEPPDTSDRGERLRQ